MCPAVDFRSVETTAMERLMQAFRTEEAFANVFEQVRVHFSTRVLSKLVALIRKNQSLNSFDSRDVSPH